MVVSSRLGSTCYLLVSACFSHQCRWPPRRSCNKKLLPICATTVGCSARKALFLQRNSDSRPGKDKGTWAQNGTCDVIVPTVIVFLPFGILRSSHCTLLALLLDFCTHQKKPPNNRARPIAFIPTLWWLSSLRSPHTDRHLQPLHLLSLQQLSRSVRRIFTPIAPRPFSNQIGW